MRWQIITISLVALFAVVLVGSLVIAQTGDGFDLSWNVMGGGGSGGPLTGDGFSLRSTLGQTAIDSSSDTSHLLMNGYWPGVTKGYLEGTVWFEGLPCMSGGTVPPCNGWYPGYTVTVYESDGTTVAGQATTDANGNYSISLLTGDYVVYVQAGPFTQHSHTISVVATKYSTLDLTIRTGILGEGSAP